MSGGRFPWCFGTDLVHDRRFSLMRWRGLEPPRGSKAGVGGCRDLAGSGFFPACRWFKARGSRGGSRGVLVRNWYAVLVVAACALVLAPVASARFKLRGNVRPQLWAWAREAAVNVPLPNVTVRVVVGYNPFWQPRTRTLYLPRGWSDQAVHGLFLHELGHAFDTVEMTRTSRSAFSTLAGTTCGWWQRPCESLNRRSGQTILIPPAEMFAEAYDACALGLTRHQVDDAGFNTYGWDPPDGSDAALCDLIRQAPSVRAR